MSISVIRPSPMVNPMTEIGSPALVTTVPAVPWEARGGPTVVAHHAQAAERAGLRRPVVVLLGQRQRLAEQPFRVGELPSAGSRRGQRLPRRRAQRTHRSPRPRRHGRHPIAASIEVRERHPAMMAAPVAPARTVLAASLAPGRQGH
jgi:hypothetical protein